ncbi:hypothetical protein ACJX0J_042584, partial [Zea mays]
ETLVITEADMLHLIADISNIYHTWHLLYHSHAMFLLIISFITTKETKYDPFSPLTESISNHSFGMQIFCFFLLLTNQCHIAILIYILCGQFSLLILIGQFVFFVILYMKYFVIYFHL